MKKLTLVHAACLLACGASLSTAQTQQGLQGNILSTPEIIVTASRSEQVLQTAPVGATIITRAQIESAGVVDANEAIRKIGGVAGKTDLNGGRNYMLDLRGFGATADNNTVVLVDGIRISENEQAAARLSGISANNIERIEILRGGSSVMWGEGATSGVINIITRADRKAGVSGQIGVGAESYGGRDGAVNLRVGSASGQSAFDINARSNSSTGYRLNNQSSQDVISMGVSSTEGALSARARVENETSNNRFPGALSFTQFAADPRQASATQLNNWGTMKQTRFNTGVDYRFGNWTAIVDVGIKQKSVQSFFNPGPSSTTATKTTQLSPRAVYKGNVGSTALTANVGLDMSKWGYTNDGAYDSSFALTTRTGTQKNRAIYAMTDWLLPSQTRIVAGYRTESIDKTSQDASTAPALASLNNKLTASELSLNQTVQQGLDVYVRTAKSYRMANIDDYATNNPFVALRPQISNDKELGVKLRQAKSNYTARYFWQNTVDEIAYDPTSFTNTNLAPTKRSGLELQGASELSSAITLSGSLQAMSAIFDGGANAGKHIPLVSERSATARMAYRVDAKQSVETAWRMLGSSYFSGDNSNSCGKKIPSTQMLDALYRWRESAFDVSFGVTNLTNKSTYNFAYSCATGSLYPEAGRALRATLKYNF
jgi:iron complex outermembrane recepter protein